MSHQSRFFPSAVYGGSPPPEESDHPVHSGDASSPLVKFPAPKPNVRLPPGQMFPGNAAQGDSVSMPSRHLSYGGIQPLVKSSDWQARFNGLFGRISTTTAAPPSPPKTPPKANVPAATIMALSKADVLDLSESRSLTVSLPNSISRSSATRQGPTTKAMVDDIFDGELSFGSTPRVSVPRNAQYADTPINRRLHILHMRPSAKYDKPVEPRSIFVRDTADGISTQVWAITIRIGGRPVKEIPFKSKDKVEIRKASTKTNKAKPVQNAAAKDVSTSKAGSRATSFQRGPAGGPSGSPKLMSTGSPQKDVGATPTPGSTPKPLKYHKGRKASSKVQTPA